MVFKDSLPIKDGNQSCVLMNWPISETPLNHATDAIIIESIHEDHCPKNE